MQLNPLVSIIIPTYNRGNVIQGTLDSIIAQTYTNWECIIIDDGSTDCTIQVLQSYIEKDTRFQFFERPKNFIKGPSVCRNYGYEKCKGDYIQWFDSDDTMHPDKLKIKLEYALNCQADVIIDEHSENRAFKEIENIMMDHFISDSFYVNFLLGQKPVITNDVMLKRTIIGLKRFDENLWKGEEFEFYGRVFKQNLCYCFLDAKLTYYSISPDSISISPQQSESLIYLSKKLQLDHASNELITERAKRQGRKTYKSLAIRGDLKMILKHFNFFRKAHHKSILLFSLFVIYNLLTGRGYHKIKPKETN